MALEFTTVSWSVKQLVKMVEKGTITFDYPIQRADGQWSADQHSLLMDSYARNYPIPALYFVGDKEEIMVMKKGVETPETVVVRTTIDGKQRLTNTVSFVKGETRLQQEKPVQIDGEEFEIAGKSFEELDEPVQDMILSRTLTTYTIDGELATDEEIKDLLFRLNNGVAMTIQQKAKSLMGLKWAKIINELGEHLLIKEIASFSKGQLRQEAHLTALIQTMMMIDGDYDYKNVQQSTISDYSQTFESDEERKMELVAEVKKAMDYLLEVLDKKETVLLKKVHFPMTLITALKAMQMDVQPEEFYEWLMYFKNIIKKPDEVHEHLTMYLEYTGKGTTDKGKAVGRMKEMIRHMQAYFESKKHSQEA